MFDLGKLRDIEALKISLASADDILSWSYGEVTKPETINYRSLKPEKGGLFCEQIFGPVKDYECYCGKYKRIRYKGVKCDRCGVQVTTSKVRRERMGHITLAAPVAHVWFFKNVPSKLATLIGISPRNLEMVIYFSSFIVTNIDYDAKTALLDSFPEMIKNVKHEAKDYIDQRVQEIENDTKKAIDDLTAKANKAETEEPKSKKSKTKESAVEEPKAEGKIEAKIEALKKKMDSKIEELRNSLNIETEKRELRLRKIEKKLMEVELFTVISDAEYVELIDYLDQFCTVGIGAEAILNILSDLDINKLSSDLQAEMGTSKSLKYKKLIKRAKLVDTFIKGNVDPKAMIVSVLPVIPPDLRPMVMLEGGRFASSDINDLYRRIINRNNRLKRLNELGAPDIIVRNEKRMLQEAVDALFDSSKVRKSRTRTRKEYRSIADAIKGKTGYFRANLLGKRVDYSGRAVIVAGPDLNLDECGLPTEMALELFRPLVIREVMSRGLAPNMKTAKYLIEERSDEIWRILEDVVKDRTVLLNRAPTLHRLSIQAFKIRLTTGKAIQLHPVVCAGFNADFDGDQMAVHVPLSSKSINEAKEIMISSKNLLKPADGSIITYPSKDMILGIYYLTSVNADLPHSKKVFADRDELMLAFNNHSIDLRQLIKLVVNDQILETTTGRVIFNDILPEKLRYFNNNVGQKDVRKFINETLNNEGVAETVRLIDALKTFGFKYATKSGISLSIFDCVPPKDFEQVISHAKEEVELIEQNYQLGLTTEKEKRRESLRVWQTEVIDKFDRTILEGIAPENPVRLIISAGASKASAIQLRQIAAIKGLVADLNDKIFEMPIFGNYSTGMSSFDYFLTNRGVRKTYMDKGLGTADAGYLTRRLVNVAQNILVREDDCGSVEGIKVSSSEITPLMQWWQRIIGRVSVKDIYAPDAEVNAKTSKADNKAIVKANELITEDIAKAIDAAGIKSVEIHSALTCQSEYGICKKCYGIDLGTNKMVQIGLAVGIIAAQSIGEPGTQLTMRTFHSGGVVGANITQGLPRIEEIFEARNPKNAAVISEVSGKVRVDETEEGRTVTVDTDEHGEIIYRIEIGQEIIVKDGDLVSVGSALTSGYMPLQTLYRFKGMIEAAKYIINEIQQVYGSQGVSINDKHIEVIVKQMFNRVTISDEGDTTYLAGDTVTLYQILRENRRVKKLGGKEAKFEPILVGITKASRMADSWLDAASFEQTSAVLTENAVAGTLDDLIGLKENVIIGRKIPVGTDALLTDSAKEGEIV